MTRPFNSLPALPPFPMPSDQAASEMLDWHGSGMGVMEMSHRGKEFMSIYEEAEADLRELAGSACQFQNFVHARWRDCRKRHRAFELVARRHG
jgi:phosphoserine aminotransferase